MKLRSLHARMVVATAVWTIIVLSAAILVAIVAVHINPRSARTAHDGLMALAAAALVTAGASVIRRGLLPLRTLQEHLNAVREGRAQRLEGDYPIEVTPLVDDLNALLEERERRVSRAVARAGDLAHGLKTPLAVLAHEIDRADAASTSQLAGALRQQVRRMQRQIDSHLAQARATAADVAADARTDVTEVVRALIRTMDRLYVDRGLRIEADTAPEVHARVAVEDLEEMLGNLLDNACKWARSRVRVTSRLDGNAAVIDLDDDGRGLEPGARQDVLRRGVRLDESAPGFGLGLSIVSDLADAYGGTIALHQSPEGGLRARLTLPAATAGTRANENGRSR